MIVSSVKEASDVPKPLHPEQILAGSPSPRGRDIGVSPDGNFSCCIWECAAGSFRYTYNSDEIIHVLEGSATITPVGGETRTVNAGDVAYFPKGLVTDWVIKDHVKKLAIHRSQPHTLRSRVKQKIQRLLLGGS